MSRARKHVEEEILSHFPEPNENERIVQVIESRGRNTLEVSYPGGESILALIPAKFQKKIWIKKGSFVIIEPTFLVDASSKVLAVVTHALFAQDIEHLIDQNLWPEEFLQDAKESFKLREKPTNQGAYLDMDFMSESDEEDDLEEAFGRNPNHRYEIDEGSSEEED